MSDSEVRGIIKELASLQGKVDQFIAQQASTTDRRDAQFAEVFAELRQSRQDLQDMFAKGCANRPAEAAAALALAQRVQAMEIQYSGLIGHLKGIWAVASILTAAVIGLVVDWIKNRMHGG